MSNIVWTSYRKDCYIDEPFLAYVGRHALKHFGDFLYDSEPTSANIAEDFRNGRYGTFEPHNLIDIALSSSRAKKYFEHEKDNQVIDYLYDLKSKLIAQEKQLYTDLGCKNFKEFKRMYEGDKKRISGKDHKNYWLNQHLKYFTGEYQRLFASHGYTLIEQLLALAAIELDEVGVYGLEDDGKGKREIKNALLQAKFLEIPERKVNFKQSKEIDVYIPTLKYRKGTDKEFIDALADFFEAKGTEAVAKEVHAILDDQLNVYMSQALKKIGVKLQRVKPSEKAKKQYVRNMFVKLKFDQIPAGDLKALTKEVLNYIHTVRNYAMSNYQKKNWEIDNADGKMAKYIDKQISYLCQEFYRTGKVDFVSGSKKDNIVMGFFGELADFGRNLFNIKGTNENIEVFNIGGLLNAANRKQLGIDNVLIVNGNKYGIQVKNPFQVTKTKTMGDYYKIYKSSDESLTLDEMDKKKNIYKIQNIFGFSDEEYDNFIMYNLNINNSSNPQKLRQDIEKFCFLYADAFARLDTQEIALKVEEDQNKYLEMLEGNSVNNVFFVLKGEIFPCSYIVNGLIKQYEFFLNSWKDYNKKGNAYKKTLIVNYTNEVPRNYVTQAQEKTLTVFGHYDGGGAHYVHTWQNGKIQQDLKKIKYRHYIRLAIPGVNMTDD